MLIVREHRSQKQRMETAPNYASDRTLLFYDYFTSSLPTAYTYTLAREMLVCSDPNLLILHSKNFKLRKFNVL